MLRIVADTNIFISALNFGGTCEDVLALARSGRLLVCISPPVLAEVRGVLRRKFGWSARKAREAVSAIRAFTQLVDLQTVLRVVKEDDPDNRILECALEARAEVVVTGDRHLLKLGRFRGIAILRPAEFLESQMWVE